MDVVSPSSLIFVAVIAIWASYLFLHVARRREHLATARTVDRFSTQMRVLQRRAVRVAAEAPIAESARSSSRPLRTRPLVAATSADSFIAGSATSRVAAGAPSGVQAVDAGADDTRVLPAVAQPAASVAGADASRPAATGVGVAVDAPAAGDTRPAAAVADGAQPGTSGTTAASVTVDAPAADAARRASSTVNGALDAPPAAPTAPTATEFAAAGTPLVVTSALSTSPDRATYRKRRVRVAALALAVFTTIVTGALAAFGVLSVFVPVAAVAATVAVLWWLRIAAVAERQARRRALAVERRERERAVVLAREAALAARPSAPVMPVAQEHVERRADPIEVAEAAHTQVLEVAATAAMPAIDPLLDDREWAPTPVPPPTYTLKARAERPMPEPLEVPVPIEVDDDEIAWDEQRHQPRAVNA